MGGRVDAHRRLVGIFAGDAFVHLEQVAVALFHRLPAQARNRVGKVQVDTSTLPAHLWPNSQALVAHVLGPTRSDVSGHQVAEARIDALEVVVAPRLRDLRWVLGAIFGAFWHPNPAIIASDSLIKVSFD